MSVSPRDHRGPEPRHRDQEQTGQGSRPGALQHENLLQRDEQAREREEDLLQTEVHAAGSHLPGEERLEEEAYWEPPVMNNAFQVLW